MSKFILRSGRGATAALGLFLLASAWLTHHAHRLEDSLKSKEENTTASLLRQPAPEFSLPLLRASSPAAGGGAPQQSESSQAVQKVSLADYRGKIVLVSFWASWCRPCDYELPLLSQFYAENQQRGVEVIGISIDSDRRAALRYAESRRLNLPLVWDAQGRVADLYKVESLPTLVVIDREGRIRQAERGLRYDLESWLQTQIRSLSPGAARTPEEAR